MATAAVGMQPVSGPPLPADVADEDRTIDEEQSPNIAANPVVKGMDGDLSTSIADECSDDSKPGPTKTAAPTQRAMIGFAAQYFAVGLIYGGIPATVYGVFLGYLNVPAYVYATVSVISSLPWSFKFIFGLINDTVPICGLRRKPYMVIGWAFCAVVLFWLSCTPLPPPYWCIDDMTGEYIKKIELPGGHHKSAEPCHPESAQAGGKYAILLMLAALGYVVADVAADGLTTEYAKAEPMEKRGTTQTTAYMMRTIGQAAATVFIAFFMNGKEYNGSFDWGLRFEQVAFCLGIPASLMVPISVMLVVEPKRSLQNAAERVTIRRYFAMCWDLLQSKAFFYVFLYSFLTSVIGGITTTAGPQVKINWAGVENFENQLFSLFGSVLFAFGLWLVKKRFLHTSWHKLLAVTIVFLQVVDCFFTSFTIFNVFRNPFFYLGEAVLTEIPLAANFVVSTFVIVEMADDGNEGLVYGLLTTSANLGYPFARALGNQIYRLFQPSLSYAGNYIEDEPSFRRTVFYSFVLSYGFALLSLSTLYFLPRQKLEAQEWKRTWHKRPAFAVITVAMLGVAFAYSMVVNFMSMFPATMCLEFAGGDGCE
mmetsp:Transcript_108219/g.312783  ORF Transcript_108219/g.312783 Transcript_108219/m.312783 type:complete len:594 (-) Transcript_108219:52-1833(-)